MKKIDRKLFGSDRFSPKTVKTMNRLIDSMEANYEVIDDAWLNSLEMIAMNYELLYSAYDDIKENGKTSKDPRSRILRNPSIAIFNNAQQAIQSIFSKMGLTVMSKARAKSIMNVDADSSDEFEEAFLQ